jgi:hypothetical protein
MYGRASAETPAHSHVATSFAHSARKMRQTVEHRELALSIERSINQRRFKQEANPFLNETEAVMCAFAHSSGKNLSKSVAHS